MSTETEITTAHAMHLGSLRTAEALARKAIDFWSTGLTNSAAAAMESIEDWSKQMQTVVEPLAVKSDSPTP